MNYSQYPDWPKIDKEATRTVRLAGTEEGTWHPMRCQVADADGEGAAIYVPEWRGTWLIHKSGAMIANVGGNDWRIYTLHPDDAAALCAKPTPRP